MSDSTNPEGMFANEALFTSEAPTPHHTHQGNLDAAILDEIKGHVHGQVRGFFERYFKDTPWSSDEQNSQIISQAKWSISTISLLFAACLHGDNMFLSHPGRGATDFVLEGASQRFLVAAKSAYKRPRGWGNIQVVGLFQMNPGNQEYPGLLHLYRCAREVFRSQPMRLFLHGFSIFGTRMQLWIFDRSGIYGSESFDVERDRERLVHVITSYKRMSDANLGINQFVRSDTSGHYVSFKDEDSSFQQKFYLDGEPISFPQKIMSESSICYRARLPGSTTSEFVLKFSWKAEVPSSEGKILRIVNDRGVRGVVKGLGHEFIETTSNLHRGLRVAASTDSVLYADNNSNEVPAPNLTFSCLAMSPLGRPLANSVTLDEFIEANRDAIEGHYSLYVYGGVLHQNISTNNIIIPMAKKEGEPRGVLIDLNQAMELAVGPTRPNEIIGTKPFMAIGLLEGNPHTYRHDLESFLYVFLWTAICGGETSPPPQSRLQRWLTGSRADLAWKKRQDMGAANFVGIVSEFTDKFKILEGLAYRLRGVLFPPLQNGSLFTGTRTETHEMERLYCEMRGAFDDYYRAFMSCVEALYPMQC